MQNNSKLNIQNSQLSSYGIGEFVKWYKMFYEINSFKEIIDPVQWQKDIRNEWGK